ncbi:type III pantothenate kinase [Echinicola sediminis]
MRNLIIDIGNTRIKSALFEDHLLLEESTVEYIDDLLQAISKWSYQRAIISSVRWAKEELEVMLPFEFLYLENGVDIPVKNGYETPHTLGLDRLAAAIGALGTAGSAPVLSIDMGTCITYDFIDEASVFQGGAISPGFKMRFQAMSKLTARLPEVAFSETENVPELVGRNTINGIKSGVYHGIKHEVAGVISQYLSKHPDLKVFICGGDAKFFESLTKDHIFVLPNLVLHGLNRILIYNADKN